MGSYARHLDSVPLSARRSQLTKRFIIRSVAALAFLVSTATAARTPCESIEFLSLPETVVISARDIPAGPLRIEVPGVSGVVPAFCRVTLRVRAQIYIEVWLPRAEAWNKRFRGEGGAGWAGWVSYVSMVKALEQGYATASTDTGHALYMGGTFALNEDRSLNYDSIIDFSWRSIYELTRKSKEIIRAYYGEPVRYSYWNGCSTGGRQGLAAVQRFPEEYDGVLAGSPAINWDRFVPGLMWPYLLMLHETGYRISAAKLNAATNAAIAYCDDDDGVTDGIINNPRECNYDTSTLVCDRDNHNENCLTMAEANVIRKIWDGPKASGTGQRLWFGLQRGASLTRFSEPYGDPSDYLRYWIKQDPGFDWHTLSVEGLERAFRESQAKFQPLIGTDDPNLQRWSKHGGKLLLWHDESDEVIPPEGTLDYFDRILAANGGSDNVAQFARLYLVPGSSHCGSNTEVPIPSNMFGTLVDWVENGIAPKRVTASQRLSTGAVRTRPLCPYPTVSKWTGQGNSNDAANFMCAMPDAPRAPRRSSQDGGPASSIK